MTRKVMKVKVYMDMVNYLGYVTNSFLIAQFASMNWAEKFIAEAKKSEDEITKIRVEVIE